MLRMATVLLDSGNPSVLFVWLVSKRDTDGFVREGLVVVCSIFSSGRKKLHGGCGACRVCSRPKDEMGYIYIFVKCSYDILTVGLTVSCFSEERRVNLRRGGWPTIFDRFLWVCHNTTRAC